MKEIKRYIEFAIENGYNKTEAPHNKMIDMFNLEYKSNFCFPNFIEIITSKEYIEAVVEGLKKNIQKQKLQEFRPETYMAFNYSFVLTYDKFDLIKFKEDEMLEGIKRELTTRQAIAIRDGTLDIFINDLLGREQK